MGKREVMEQTDKDYAEMALDMIPERTEDITRFLKAQKVHWGDHGAFTCPVANYLRKWLDSNHVSVNGFRYRYNGDLYDLPNHVRDWVYRYDLNRL